MINLIQRGVQDFQGEKYCFFRRFVFSAPPFPKNSALEAYAPLIFISGAYTPYAPHASDSFHK
jgi:hypothetical protein